MRIAFDCRSAFHGMGGIGRYTWSLLHEFAELDREHTWLCYFTHLSPPDPLRLPDNFHVRIFEAGMIDERFDHFVLPGLLREDEIDLYHNPTFAVPLVRSQARCTATVHDVVFRRHPELVEDRLRRYLDAATRRTARWASRVITVSEFSKGEITTLYEVDSEKIAVIHNGVHPPPDRIRHDPGAHGTRFLLYVGSIEPKKNIDFLLESFRLIRRQFPELKLVLAGTKLYAVEDVIAKLGLVDAVWVTGYVSQDRLEALYSACEAFIYPSLYEGFGLPPLEAMKRGVPTVVTETSSLPEVVGDAAVCIDPGDPRKLAEALSGLLADEDRKRDLKSRGPKRAAEFTWRKAAIQHLELFDSVLRS